MCEEPLHKEKPLPISRYLVAAAGAIILLSALIFAVTAQAVGQEQITPPNQPPQPAAGRLL